MDMCNEILKELSQLWDAPELVATTKVVVSARMRRSLGICRVARKEVAIAAGLVAEQDRALLREVIVHEAAHLVVWGRFGRGAKAHGEEWAALVRMAGVEPRSAIAGGEDGRQAERLSAGLAVQGNASAGSGDGGAATHECPFCGVKGERLFHEGGLVVGVWDAFPVSPGHALIVPKRHVATWFDATPEEHAEIIRAIGLARTIIEQRYHPDGFNIGVNVGEAAGQTIFHLHVHIIPRYEGDLPDPRGGVRNLFPGKGLYGAMPKGTGKGSGAAGPHGRALISGSSDPLLPHILAMLDTAVAADIVVAFVMESGVRQIIDRLKDLLSRGGRLRFLTGDYLDVTEPGALLHLLDLEGNIELKVFESKGRSFHPKTYIFGQQDGGGVAFVGSSNLSASALGDGIEWNYRVLSSRAGSGFSDVREAFEALFSHPSARVLDHEWVAGYRARRPAATTRTVDVAPEPPPEVPEPHEIQKEALAALKKTREEGNKAGLVVLATGLGKTWLSAFDSADPKFRRILFVAHREEILSQAMATFRKIRPLSSLGKYTGTEKDRSADILFASIQTIGRRNHLKAFARDEFDYIVVDEFHHAWARSYRTLIDHFDPEFMLGLTATPERMDGGDLLALCQENLVYRCDLAKGIGRGLLASFRYFGVPDEIDYRNIPWKSRKFDEETLTSFAATESRARNALEQYRQKGGSRALAFCCSVRHADYMADFFNEEGVKSVAVHSGPGSAPRAWALESLRDGLLEVVFAVDMFNEGIDLPDIDTIIMLRPTESRIIWLQQFGRGLRKKSDERPLTVIDYIGNHRVFLLKPLTLLGLGASDAELALALKRLQACELELPPGCEVTYELKAIEILKGLLRVSADAKDFDDYYSAFKDREGQRPTATEAMHDGFSPRLLRSSHGGWIQFLKTKGDLDEKQSRLAAEHQEFFRILETTQMVRSYKMVTLHAMMAAGDFPGSVDLDSLAKEYSRIAQRSAKLRRDVSVDVGNLSALSRLLEKNPIDAWCHESVFRYEGGVFTLDIDIAENDREAFSELSR
jgi:superfamily II DNA or RNA helicase/diadenosine tetraphosphate (Ap4A) HIT family hydrolase